MILLYGKSTPQLGGSSFQWQAQPLMIWGSNIGTVVTHESYRNRGYATSVISALVERILRRSNLSLIHVESDNKPAMIIYTKVGFKSYKRYLLVTVEN